MLIIDGEFRKPRTTQQVVEWLANYVTHPGVAVTGVFVPGPDGHSTEPHLVVFTPHVAAVLEVGLLRRKIRGTLSCAMNERWSVPGISGDPMPIGSGDLNPLHRVRGPVLRLRKLAADHAAGAEPFVDGLVLVVPKPGSAVTLDRGPMPGGFSVLHGADASQLYSWFGRAAHRHNRTPWTAELVVQVLTALRVDRTRDPEQARRLYADLVAEGFPAEDQVTDTSATSTPVPPDLDTPPDPARPPVGDAAVPVTEFHRGADLSGPHADPTVTGQQDEITPSRHDAPPTAPARHRVRTALLGLTAVAVLAAGVGYLAVNDHSRRPADNHPAPRSDVRPPPGGPPPTASPPSEKATVPQRNPSPLPSEPAPCYPFQTGC